MVGGSFTLDIYENRMSINLPIFDMAALILLSIAQDHRSRDVGSQPVV